MERGGPSSQSYPPLDSAKAVVRAGAGERVRTGSRKFPGAAFAPQHNPGAVWDCCLGHPRGERQLLTLRSHVAPAKHAAQRRLQEACPQRRAAMLADHVEHAAAWVQVMEVAPKKTLDVTRPFLRCRPTRALLAGLVGPGWTTAAAGDGVGLSACRRNDPLHSDPVRCSSDGGADSLDRRSLEAVLRK